MMTEQIEAYDREQTAKYLGFRCLSTFDKARGRGKVPEHTYRAGRMPMWNKTVLDNFKCTGKVKR